MMEGECPFCDGVDQVSISANKDVICCNGYKNGIYVTIEACDTYASDGDGSCKYCIAGGFANIIEDFCNQPYRGLETFQL